MYAAVQRPTSHYGRTRWVSCQSLQRYQTQENLRSHPKPLDSFYTIKDDCLKRKSMARYQVLSIKMLIAAPWLILTVSSRIQCRNMATRANFYLNATCSWGYVLMYGAIFNHVENRNNSFLSNLACTGLRQSKVNAYTHGGSFLVVNFWYILLCLSEHRDESLAATCKSKTIVRYDWN